MPIFRKRNGGGFFCRFGGSTNEQFPVAKSLEMQRSPQELKSIEQATCFAIESRCHRLFQMRSFRDVPAQFAAGDVNIALPALRRCWSCFDPFEKLGGA